METFLLHIKGSILWDKTLCSPLNFNGNFGGTCGLHLQDLRISQTRNQREVGSKKNPLMGPEAGLGPLTKREICAPELTGLL
jgi:hypothetical protein